MVGRGGRNRGGQNIRGIKDILYRRGGRYNRIDDDLEMTDGGEKGGQQRRFVNDDHSPQSSGCFQSLLHRRNRGNNRQTSGGGRTILQRLGLPVRRGRGTNNKVWTNQKTRNLIKTQSGQIHGTWNRIAIKQGQLWGGTVTSAKNEIIKVLSNYIDEQFTPFLFKINDIGDAVFFLEDNDISDAIQTANRRIVEPKSGKKILIIVSKANKPYADLSPEEQEVVKLVLSKRFNPQTQNIDLSRFGLDPDFQSHNLIMSLQRNNVLSCVVKLIIENCPHIQSIDLSHNRLKFLDWLAPLVYKTKNVQRLLLCGNQILHTNELEKLKGWPLVELNLDQNPVCDKFSSVEAYVSAIHRIFPKVVKLDETEVKSSPGFDIEEDTSTKLPTLKPGFFVNDNLKNLILTFVNEYFTFYDGPTPDSSRKNLLAAYDDKATFTLTMTQLEPEGRYSDNDLYLEYRRDSHNILMMEHWERYRNKIVHRDSLNIISRLCRLPKTQHLKESFIIDVSLATDTLLCFTVNGLFRDGDYAGTESEEMRFFSRSFLVVPRGEGKVAVLNEQLFISPFSPGQSKRYMHNLHKTNNSQIQVPAVAYNPGPSTSAFPTQEQILERFVQESKMKPEWAKKCLDDNEWNYEKAGQVFISMQQQGVIPADAFL